MLKYTLGALAALAVTVSVSFVVLSRLNDGRAQAGPVPELTVTVDDSSVSPSRFEVPKGRLAILTFTNNAALTRRISVFIDDVEQSLFDSNGTTHGAPTKNLSLLASPGKTSQALVRFKAAGSYELNVETPGRPETLRVVLVVAK